MKRLTYLGIVVLFLAPALSYGDICSDVKSAYEQRLQTLTMEYNTALSMTTDTAQRDALTLNYNMQKDALIAEMDATLTSAGCTTTGGSTDGTGGGTTPPPPTIGDGGGSTTGGGTDPVVTCDQKIEAFKADIESKKATMSKSDLVHYMNTKKAEIKDCTQWGRVRSRVNPL
jgi:hypothetical protein